MTAIKTPVFSDDDILLLLAEQYNLTGKLTSLPGYCDQNLLLNTNTGQQFIVKIANSAEPRIELDMQNEAMAHLTRKELAVPHVIANQSGDLISDISAQDQQFCLRVLTFLPGQFYAQANSDGHNKALWQDLGQFIANIDIALADFQHAGAYRYLEWDLAQGYRVCMTKKQLLASNEMAVVEHFLSLYHNQTMPLLAQ